MKYANQVVINKPLKRVIELFDNPENMKHWQPGLISYQEISGSPGMPGAKMKLQYKMGKRDVEMIETVETRNLPEEFSGTYEAKGVWNRVSNHFEAIDANTTKWSSESEFKFNSLMMKIFGFFMPGAFKKQSQKYLDMFKEFAEKS
jgi:carbon monoxide dehydrogenase subunit G